jgi:hypothetical protein
MPVEDISKSNTNQCTANDWITGVRAHYIFDRVDAALDCVGIKFVLGDGVEQFHQREASTNSCLMPSVAISTDEMIQPRLESL